jgi:hypothetical protein
MARTADLRVDIANGGNQGNAIHLRHGQVREQQVDLPRLQVRHRLFRRVEAPGRVALPTENVAERTHLQCLVVDDQKACGHGLDPFLAGSN